MALREEHTVEEFWLYMIQKPVEIGVYARPIDPELDDSDADFISSHTGILNSYHVTEDKWSFRLRDDPNLYEVDRRSYTVLISYYG